MNLRKAKRKETLKSISTLKRGQKSGSEIIRKLGERMEDYENKNSRQD
jgi:predicted CopG family antitoxin